MYSWKKHANLNLCPIFQVLFRQHLLFLSRIAWDTQYFFNVYRLIIYVNPYEFFLTHMNQQYVWVFFYRLSILDSYGLSIHIGYTDCQSILGIQILNRFKKYILYIEKFIISFLGLLYIALLFIYNIICLLAMLV